MFLKNGVLVNRFIVLDFLIAIIFLIGGLFCAISPPQSIALFKKLSLD
ncbi:hypothetical protein HPHPP4D_0204 [Helicobacter pylori Hp P-4d]|uniref:Uncharacterized protein n=1 Tax=Helicobacter pylori Hp P-4 TaxID=992075 RepID=J0EWR3_HELPX|nr:hypothetical protein HPHPP4_0169 [Helicobacter pylori Hp P-4]EJC24264.1 hypothetical protein HPHPP4C_0206 [Helicobacter pylori Hp P-4c]EJC25479.1 hypothetical protein HPHPP4D_0204 [Helicobacter pylori Hp P-4d]